ncbi:transposase [Streptomyces canus]
MWPPSRASPKPSTSCAASSCATPAPTSPRRSEPSEAARKQVPGGRPPVWPRRQLIDGIMFRIRTGVPWRDVPAEYGPWGRIYDLFRRWQRNGTWQRILTRLQSLANAKGAIVWDLSIDSTVCRAHQPAAGARRQGDLQKEPPGGVFTEPRDHGLGRSRGGFTTQVAPGRRAGAGAHVEWSRQGSAGTRRSSNRC